MYDKEELEIVEYIEKSKPASIPNLDGKINKIKAVVNKKHTKASAVAKKEKRCQP